MAEFVLSEVRGDVGIITLNRPAVMNAWHTAMRNELVAAFEAMDVNDRVRAVILTGAGERAFGAGQDLNETKTFDPDRAETWMHEWERLYESIRSLTKPVIAALNGVAAGSAFQVALLCDLRVGHPGVKMGQPEINSGIASVTGPWIMREIIGLAHTIDLTLTGRMMDADECYRIGVLSRLVPQSEVMPTAMKLAEELASKPPVAMRMNRARFREMTQHGFEEAMAAGIRTQRAAYATGEPARMMEAFLASRSTRKS